MGIGPQAAAIERSQDAGLAAQLGIVDRGVRLVTVDMERAAAAEIQQRKGVICSSSRQRTIARLPSFGMMNDSDEELTLRGWIEIPYFAAMSMNMRPSQSLA